MKTGIHSSNWDKLIQAIRDEIPEPYATQVIKILERLSTPYF